ncbi:DUF6541 family protein [Tautonia marina]|uniref:DUF6541 family protein n=1 Tax=Tautonia marina TaxID=2653855 RepID=UPI001375BBC8|nr:DUF6541 family protein [Tautonia marina]
MFGNPALIRRATLGFVLLGLGLRLFRYLSDFPLWCDESRLAANLIALADGEAGFFGPLRYAQTAPVGFLLVETGVIQLIGFSTWSLRLVPLLCALASVLVFRHLAGRLLSGYALLFAVAIFAVSWWPLGFGSEVKPYASDLFLALSLLAITLEWLRSPERVGWLWALAVVAVLAIPLSFPSVFVIGGVCLGLAAPVARRGGVGTWAAYLTLLVIPATMFAVLLPMYQIEPGVRAYLDQYWADAFPPMDHPVRVFGWLVGTHTGMLFAYPIGAPYGGSVLTALCVVAGARALWLRGHRTLVVVCLAPLALCFAAAVLQRYPYGEKPRTMQFIVPAVCLLAGQGLSSLLRRIQNPVRRQRSVRIALVAHAALAVVFVIVTVVHPYKLRRDLQAREFASWFWENMDHEAEVVCARDDLGIIIDPRHWNGAWSDYYLCYREIYSERHREDRPVKFERITKENPLKCVFFYERPDGAPVFEDWMKEMKQSFVLRDVEEYKVRGWDPGAPDFETNYYVYEFIPRRGVIDSEIPVMASRSAEPWRTRND